MAEGKAIFPVGHPSTGKNTDGTPHIKKTDKKPVEEPRK